MKYRVFRDHAGRIHRVKRSREEIADGRRMAAAVYGMSVLFLVIASFAAGIII